ncbi:Allene oxide synthase-lipoxygenase protein [Hypsibius exemplaris]|uniref:Allene oxide synthase-lipoxygenase protein n=1 Tax=Hypsibius exemplaris TaxID=2072580 RepID=A0A1W0WPG6_HYPEX|nr:Allene oxide synthase-lipoxygenase protein [Hypsibius exemplaris]
MIGTLTRIKRFFWRDVNVTSPWVVHVKTGDRKGAGTDATVWVRLRDESGQWTDEIKLSSFWHNDHERGQLDSFPLLTAHIGVKFGELDKLEIWRDAFGIGDSWFLDVITVENIVTRKMYHFPAQRWIRADTHYVFNHYDTCLPQFDQHREQRQQELEEKKRMYEYVVHHPGLPAQVRKLPEDECFSDSYKWDIITHKVQFIKDRKFISLTTGSRDHWESWESLTSVYKYNMPVPQSKKDWNNDIWFGMQRLQGCNPVLIRLCTKQPANLRVDADTMVRFLGQSLQDAIDAKRIFMVDLKILENLPCAENRRVCAPIALFYLDKNRRDLLPLCIQLFQQPGKSNPVFYPSDNPYTWLLAKMWYNNADASYHQSCTHLGFTHLMMEGVAVCTHRNLSPSHPIFKLLAPHFLFLLAINTRGLAKLINPGGWVDRTTAIGCVGMFELIKRGCHVWRLDTHAVPPVEIAERGLTSPEILPNYPYRDDAIAVYKAIEAYVTSMVEYFYDLPEKIAEDEELQTWLKELVRSKEENGCGLQGVPVQNERFSTSREIIATMSAIISTCSVAHAAANFNQYDEYGFPPNYPAILTGKIPVEKEGYTDKDVLHQLPSKGVTLDTMVVTRLLSSKGTNSLGQFEVQYLYDPVSVSAAKQLRQDLKVISATIKARNNDPLTRFPYPWLDPDIVPNSISI